MEKSSLFNYKVGIVFVTWNFTYAMQRASRKTIMVLWTWTEFRWKVRNNTASVFPPTLEPKCDTFESANKSIE